MNNEDIIAKIIEYFNSIETVCAVYIHNKLKETNKIGGA
jgi:hypothetical protein